MKEMRHRLAEGVMWTGGGRILVNLLGLASTLILARVLTPSDFGLVALATTAFAIVGAFTELSMSSALVQHKSPDPSHFDAAFTMNMLRAGVMALALGAAAAPIASFYGDPRLQSIIYVLCMSTAIGGAWSPKMVQFSRDLSFRQEFTASLATKVAGFVIAIWMALTYETYWALIVGALASQIGGVAVSYVLAPYAPRFSLTRARSLLSFSAWLTLSSGIEAINYRADKLILGTAVDPHTLGQYSLGDHLAGLPSREALAPLSLVLFPAFSRLQADPDQLRKTFIRAQSLFVAVGLPVPLGFALVATPFVDVVLGPQWTSATFVIQALGLLLAVQAISEPLRPLAMSLGRTRMLFTRNIITMLVRYPLMLTGLFLGGFAGFVLGRCLSGIMFVGYDVHLMRRLCGASLREQLRSNWRALLSALLMALALIALQLTIVGQPTLLNLLILIGAGGGVYSLTTLWLWTAAGRPPGPEREALDLVSHAMRRLRRSAA